MSRYVLRSAVSFVLFALCVEISLAAGRNPILIVPARRTIMQVAFDMQKLRSATLVSYQTSRVTDTLVLHVWDPVSKLWLALSHETYRSGDFMPAFPKPVIIVTPGPPTPPELAGPHWCAGATTIDSFGIANLINTLDTHLDFSASEWRWLKRRYNLEVEDRSVERRHHGRYGRPRPDRTRSQRRDSDELMEEPLPIIGRSWTDAPAPEPVRPVEAREEK